jgi:hypothetical protein
MNRTAKRVYWGAVVAVLGVTFGLGCSPLTTIAWLRDDGKVQAQYKLEPKNGNKDVMVAVLVSTAPEIATKPQYATLDRDLALAVGKTLVQETAKEKVKVQVVDASRVERLRSASPERFAVADRAELAQRLGADYLIQVNLSEFGLYGNGGFGKELPQGHAGMDVAVYEAGATDGAKKHDYPFGWTAPQRATGDIPASGYQRWFVSELGKKVAQHHVKHTADRENSMFRGKR